jgi:hypothetical protein
MTDIWRSFVAQRCLWEMNERVVFHGPEVFQERNQHNLLDDFRQEVPGYLSNGQIAEELLKISLKAGAGNAGSNLMNCYETLVAKGHIPEAELGLIRLWLKDLAGASTVRNG